MSILLLILSIMCFVYSICVAALNSGSTFFIMWDIIGALLILIAWGTRVRIWEKMRRVVKTIICSVLSLGLIVLTFVLILIFSEYTNNETSEVDYLIILGAQMRDDGPSVVLKYRLDRAVKYLEEYPKAKAIVSGERGKNEPCTEAEGMARYLISNGIDDSRIFLEDRSKNTNENFKYSVNMIPGNAKVGVLTNNFHMKRALYLAGRHGIDNPVAIVAYSTPFYAPNNILREVLALIKDFIFN